MIEGLSSPPIKDLSLLFVKVADVAPPNNNSAYVDVDAWTLFILWKECLVEGLLNVHRE